MAGKKTTKSKKSKAPAAKPIDDKDLRNVVWGGKAKTADKAFNAMDSYIRG